MVLVHVAWHLGNHLARVHVHAHQSHAVCSYPDVAVAVATHAVYGIVNAYARQFQLVSYAGVPLSYCLVVHEQRALAVQPDVVHLVGKCLQRTSVAQSALGYVRSHPHGVLLVHHVAAGYAAVLVDYQRAVAALRNAAHRALRHADGVVRIAELVEQLLLHVVADDALVRYVAPQVVVLVNVDDGRHAVDTHSREHLPHVALEALCLRMIQTVACRCRNPQAAVQRLLHGVDVAVGQRRSVLRVALEVAERISVEPVESCRRTKPHVSPRVLEYTVNLARCQSVLGVKRLKHVVTHCRHLHDHQQ